MDIVERPNILMVGATEAVRLCVRHAEALGTLRCTQVADVRDALSAALDPSVRVALLDMEGFHSGAAVELAAGLRHESRDVPLIIMSRPSGTRDLEAIRLGVADYLRTPVSARELHDSITRAIGLRRGPRDHTDECNEYARDMASRAGVLVRVLMESGVGSNLGLDAWLATVYRHDPWTSQHVRRVADYSVVIAAMLRLDSHRVAEIGRAALLHDIGRLAIPPRLIAKAEPLTDAERRIMRTYVLVNQTVSASAPYLKPLSPALGAVRELVNGSGYPRGLSGTAIPLAARVIAVAEAFDSLVGQEGLHGSAATAANAEIARLAGVYFDAEVVRAWLGCVDSGVLDQ